MKRSDCPHVTAYASLSLDGRLISPTADELQRQAATLMRFDVITLDGVTLSPPKTVTAAWLTPGKADIERIRERPAPGIVFASRALFPDERSNLQIVRAKASFSQRLNQLYREFSVRRLLCPLGCNLLSDLIAGDLVDELHLNLHPEIRGGRHLPTLTGKPGDFFPEATRWHRTQLVQSPESCGLVYRRA